MAQSADPSDANNVSQPINYLAESKKADFIYEGIGKPNVVPANQPVQTTVVQ